MPIGFPHDDEDATHTLTVKVHHGNYRAAETFTLDLYMMHEGEIRDAIADCLTYAFERSGIGNYLPHDADKRERVIIDALLTSNAEPATAEHGWTTTTLTER